MQATKEQQECASPNGAGPPQADAAELQPTSADFFDRDIQPGAEIIEGLIRERQLVVFAGPYGVGKTPFMTDLELHVLNGRAWNGRAVQKRPVVVFDFESSAQTYLKNVKNIAARLKVPVPRVPDELEVYLEQDDSKEPATAKLLAVLGSDNLQDRLDLLEGALRRKPSCELTRLSFCSESTPARRRIFLGSTRN